MAWSEDEIHRWLIGGPSPRGLVGSSWHDAAVLANLRGRPVVCVDQTIEGVHFSPGTEPRLVGRKAAARALSDLAATAGRPRAILVALSAPRGRSSKWIRGVLAGARSMARKYGGDLVGGDLASARRLASVSVAALGVIPGTRRPPGRDRVRAGQVVVLTGPVGGSLLGRHLRIRPRIAAGESLFACGATAMMDVSDGLAWDLFRLARASGVRIEIDLARVPVHADARRLARKDARRLAPKDARRFVAKDNQDPLWHALHDGEDHELIASMSVRAAGAAEKRLPGLVIVGRASRGSGLWLRDRSGRTRRWRRSEGGFEHGS